jgi:hypothetical protein
LHEFWTQYDPNQARLHAFFEGHDDIAFISPRIEKMLPNGMRLYKYRCEGKPLVIAAFNEISARLSDTRFVLFFVDKDIDDILGTPYPTDPRIYVTDVYSIENYLASADVLLRAYQSALRLAGVVFNELTIGAHFTSQLAIFHKKIMSTMAWILVARRDGKRPNLKNLNLSTMFSLTENGVAARAGSRLAAISRATGVELSAAVVRRIPAACRELKRMSAKRVVRGKFEAWFFVEYWNALVRRLHQLAKESGGKVSVQVEITHTAFVPHVAALAETPDSLQRFLIAHLGNGNADFRPVSSPSRAVLLVRRWLRFFRRW